MVADELRRQADTFIELQELQPSISRVGSNREERQENGYDHPTNTIVFILFSTLAAFVTRSYVWMSPFILNAEGRSSCD
jgi:hypothetical protein